eukprot:4539759-Amphidinium_carterae.1
MTENLDAMEDDPRKPTHKQEELDVMQADRVKGFEDIIPCSAAATRLKQGTRQCFENTTI